MSKKSIKVFDEDVIMSVMYEGKVYSAKFINNKIVYIQEVNQEIIEATYSDLYNKFMEYYWHRLNLF